MCVIFSSRFTFELWDCEAWICSSILAIKIQGIHEDYANNKKSYLWMDSERLHDWKEIPASFLLQESKLRLLVKETKNLTQQKIFCSFTSLLLQKLAKCFVPSFVFLSEGTFLSCSTFENRIFFNATCASS